MGVSSIHKIHLFAFSYEQKTLLSSGIVKPDLPSVLLFHPDPVMYNFCFPRTPH